MRYLFIILGIIFIGACAVFFNTGYVIGVSAAQNQYNTLCEYVQPFVNDYYEHVSDSYLFFHRLYGNVSVMKINSCTLIENETEVINKFVLSSIGILFAFFLAYTLLSIELSKYEIKDRVK